MMRVQEGAFAGTREIVLDDFSGGSNLVLAESKIQEQTPSCVLTIFDMSIGPGGVLTRRPDRAVRTLRDRRTGFALEGATLRYVIFRKVNSGDIHCVITPNGLYRYHPFYRTWNCEEILLDSGSSIFGRQARNVDVAVFNNRLYIASGLNKLVEWDGVNPATLISEEWPKNFQQPSVCRTHMGRLFVSGFMDIDDSRACSDIRYTEIADASTLIEALLEVRTIDSDFPTAMGTFLLSDLADSMKAVLVIFKHNSTHVLLGSTFSDPAGLEQASDLQMKTISTIRGCTGPGAWCLGEKGMYFHDETGIFLVTGPTEIKEVSDLIAPVWANRPVLGNVQYPRVTRANQQYVQLLYNPATYEVWCLLPYPEMANG